MSFAQPCCATIIIVKWQRSGLVEKKSTVTTNVELLLIMIPMAQRTFIFYFTR